MIHIEQVCKQIGNLDNAAMEAARTRQDQLTKPVGSLGRLEALSIQLAAITGDSLPQIQDKVVIVMAGDHGVTREGVSAYPSEVTPQMVINILNGGAAINVLARQAGARVIVVDIGVAVPLESHPELVARKVAPGTANMAQEPAMTSSQAEQAVDVGLEVVEKEIARGLDLVAIGEMGIGNTTPAAAITAALTGAAVADVVGRGTGINDTQLTKKITVVERALVLNQPQSDDPMDVLAKVGGLEIAGMVGVILGAAGKRVPVVIDGFISGAAALVATRLEPRAASFMIASHQSTEIGHRVILESLGLKPLFDFGMRLGEGTGAVLAMHFVESSARILSEMATFTEAGVSEKA